MKPRGPNSTAVLMSRVEFEFGRVEVNKMLSALVLCIVPGLAMAHSQADCAPAAYVSSRIVTRQTQMAGDEFDRLVRGAGIGADLLSIRESVLKVRFPAADVEITTRRMLKAYCEVVWINPALSDAQKTVRVDAAYKVMLKPVDGPLEAARVNSSIHRGCCSMDDNLAPLASAQNAGFFYNVADYTSALPLGEELIRPIPPYVNDSNKYFVVVGAAHSEKDAVRLMAGLHAQAPQFDLIVYRPYGDNASYAVMMAAWVSHDVALKALRAARARVASDAYLWACQSAGETC